MNEIQISENLPTEFSNFNICELTQKTLRSQNINNLFQIQSATFDYLYEGHNLIGRDRTGSGKTLAFSLPILERFRNNNSFKTSSGIKMMILVPTRELATQIFNTFNSIMNHKNEFSILPVYGGTSIYPQISKLENGVDVLVATPGRLIDLINRGHMDFSNLEVIVFDETDEMLKIGFQKDIEYILEAINSSHLSSKIQYLLFSATVPPWVKHIAKDFMQSDYYYINMIRNNLNQTSETIEHFKMKIRNNNEKIKIIKDLIQVNIGQTGRAIIFIDSKSKNKKLQTNK